MTDPATSELHKRRISGEQQRHAESSPSQPLKPAIKTSSSTETPKISKTVSFDAGPVSNGGPTALQESLELDDLPLESTDQEPENEGEDESDDEDDLVVYNEAEEGDTLSGSLSELSRRGTMDSELSTGASGSGRRGEIESLLLAPVDDFDDSSSDDSLLDNSGRGSAAAARNREAIDLDRPVGINTAGQSNRTVDISRQTSEESNSRNGKSRSMSYGSPITLNRPEFSNCPPMGGFAEVPLMLTDQGGPFDGLIYCDTVDSMGRPVVVLNTSALPKKSMRNQAFAYISESLEPIIAQTPYVLMFASFRSETLAKVPAAWVVGAYRKLSRPFKKNVEFVVLVRPNRLLKGLLKVMSVVVKKKAKRKVKQIKYLPDIERVTNGEVGIQHLGPKVIALMGHDGVTKNEEN
ncbi:hypothetical protein BSKO_09448 [Bryopsis sp. KO-2023]|nr:hypothetical protein BSKO_09448 [Bryopsis sp. KO-2023]